MLRGCWLVLLGLPLAWSRVSLVENGYEGLVVAISPEEEENPNLVESIKDLLTKASAELYGATRQRAYFKEVTILVPQTWNLDKAEAAVDETFEDAGRRVPGGTLQPCLWTQSLHNSGERQSVKRI